MQDNSLGNKLWLSYKSLTSRGGVASSVGLDFQNYFLGLIAYKYLSEKLEIFVNSEFEDHGLDFTAIWQKEELKKKIKNHALVELGYFTEPKYLFKNVFEGASHSGSIINSLKVALKSIGDSSIGLESEEDFAFIFEDVNLDSSKIGLNETDRNYLIFHVMAKINQLDFKTDDKYENYLGEAFEYLIHHMAYESNKKSQIYTPGDVAILLASIVSHDKEHLENVYDPVCGSASLLLSLSNKINVDDYFAQEINRDKYNLARMNMILHGINYSNFSIKLGDVLEDPMHLNMKFDAIVSNPPASAKWSSDSHFLEDERFAPYGKLAPKSKPDFAFIQHMIYQLNENGRMAVVLPHGALFRGAAEKIIREKLIEQNYLDAVIGLPANLFYSTSIPFVVLVFEKLRKSSDILFIDASKCFSKDKRRNILSDKDIDNLMDVYVNKKVIDSYSALVSMDKIKENDFNLNISRYVDTYVEEEHEDIEELFERLHQINAELKVVDNQIDELCRKFGFESPIF